ncbi:hypothetical protein F4777DRAFT_594866 [Nemania sp. FL0916]|nr:hypothetical protein F4777DRAFT_594866 [Nemania sp. FL0916]
MVSKRDTEEYDIDDDESNMKYYLQVVRQKLKVADVAYNALQATQQELRARWHDGTLSMTRGQYDEEMKRLDKEIGDLLVERNYMRTSTYTLAAKEADTERWNKTAHPDDWSYIESLASRSREPSGSILTMKKTHGPSKQDQWWRAIIKAYGAGYKDRDFVWCPITQQYEYYRAIKATHIVRHSVGEPAAIHLFGPPDDSDGHIWSTRNGIPLTKLYWEMLDDGKIAIIPTQDGDLVVVVLDEAERAKPSRPSARYPTGQALHGRILKFLNHHRPKLRYLYFCFAMNLLRRQRFEVDGWWKDHIGYADTPFAPTPGRWVRETTLRELAIRIGHLPPGEADDFVAMIKGKGPACQTQDGEAAATGKIVKDDDSDDDDEDDSDDSDCDDSDDSDCDDSDNDDDSSNDDNDSDDDDDSNDDDDSDDDDDSYTDSIKEEVIISQLHYSYSEGRDITPKPGYPDSSGSEDSEDY